MSSASSSSSATCSLVIAVIAMTFSTPVIASSSTSVSFIDSFALISSWNSRDSSSDSRVRTFSPSPRVITCTLVVSSSSSTPKFSSIASIASPSGESLSNCSSEESSSTIDAPAPTSAVVSKSTTRTMRALEVTNFAIRSAALIRSPPSTRDRQLRGPCCCYDPKTRPLIRVSSIILS